MKPKKFKPTCRTTHYACQEVMDRDGGKAECCCHTGHKCKPSGTLNFCPICGTTRPKESLATKFAYEYKCYFNRELGDVISERFEKMAEAHFKQEKPGHKCKPVSKSVARLIDVQKANNLSNEVGRLKAIIADIFYNRLGGMYALDEESCVEAIHDMIEDNKVTIARLRARVAELTEASKGKP